MIFNYLFKFMFTIPTKYVRIITGRHTHAQSYNCYSPATMSNVECRMFNVERQAWIAMTWLRMRVSFRNDMHIFCANYVHQYIDMISIEYSSHSWIWHQLIGSICMTMSIYNFYLTQNPTSVSLYRAFTGRFHWYNQ